MKRVVDLCAGTGAFSLAFKSEHIVFSNDYNKKSKIIYDHNFEEKLNTEDITEVDTNIIPDHDILTCGFPCQPFSLSGKKLGFKDIRSKVFWKLIDIMKIKKPQCVILENVKNMISHDNGNTIKHIIKSIEESGYELSYKILNTSRITGIPQNRERVYFICIRNDLNISKSTIDSILDFKDVEKKNIKDFLEPKVNDLFYYKTSDKIYKILHENVIEKNVVYQYRRTYVRKNMSGECPTLTAVMGTGGHNVPIILDHTGVRKLTPKECFNLQGFPENYKLPDIANCHLYKLAGNSVTFPIVEELSKRILKLLVSDST